jgi:hypothetical protein
LLALQLHSCIYTHSSASDGLCFVCFVRPDKCHSLTRGRASRARAVSIFSVGRRRRKPSTSENRRRNVETVLIWNPPPPSVRPGPSVCPFSGLSPLPSHLRARASRGKLENSLPELPGRAVGGPSVRRSIAIACPQSGPRRPFFFSFRRALCPAAAKMPRYSSPPPLRLTTTPVPHYHHTTTPPPPPPSPLPHPILLPPPCVDGQLDASRHNSPLVYLCNASGSHRNKLPLTHPPRRRVRPPVLRDACN